MRTRCIDAAVWKLAKRASPGMSNRRDPSPRVERVALRSYMIESNLVVAPGKFCDRVSIYFYHLLYVEYGVGIKLSTSVYLGMYSSIFTM